MIPAKKVKSNRSTFALTTPTFVLILLVLWMVYPFTAVNAELVFVLLGAPTMMNHGQRNAIGSIAKDVPPVMMSLWMMLTCAALGAKETRSRGPPNAIGSIAKDANHVASVPPGALEMINRGRQNAIGLIALVVLNASHNSRLSLIPAGATIKLSVS